MKNYYGTKLVTALAMTRLAYNDYRGWQLPTDENGADEGYLVEYQDGGAGNHPNHAGYISWSPKAQFDAAYQPTGAMSFGHALAALKAGERVARAGWNGKGMWLALSGPNGPREIAYENFWSRHASEYARLNGGSAAVLPCIIMKTATGEILMGWLASQTDMLADDWTIVED
ncbi:DUF2829 domain-containing protein [Ensifer adhaerens]|uniref:Thoeris anti-defense Tad2 family protein n=1 Tax=Ensifer adhaerens TaxID=106592 RepID=UPI0023A98AF1|nr:MW1434 family type I TA system toxin [Ensifer adhaerens]WDZ77936.1 DUF2829 domain-containing protein [Ensifer adhaerens]